LVLSAQTWEVPSELLSELLSAELLAVLLELQSQPLSQQA